MVDTRVLTYIREQQSAGYSKEQITQALAQAGYPQSLIESSFTLAQSSAADSNLLENYITSYLAQGYTPDSIRSSLLAHGFSNKEIERALSRGSFRHAKRNVQDSFMRSAVLLVFPLLALAVLFGGYFLILEPVATVEASEQEIMSLDDITGELLPLAKQDPTSARERCDTVLPEDFSRCVLAVSRESSDPKLCKEITVPRLADACYLNFIYDGHLKYCDFLKLPANIDYCTSAKLFAQTSQTA